MFLGEGDVLAQEVLTPEVWHVHNVMSVSDGLYQ